MPVSRTREQLMSGILEFLSGQDLLAVADIRAVLEREIDDAGPASLVALRDRLTLDAGWSYYPPDPLAQRIHLLLATRFIQPESRVTGLEHLNVVAGEPVIILSNHVSYADANVLHMMLHRVGCDDLAGRLTAMAGPRSSRIASDASRASASARSRCRKAATLRQRRPCRTRATSPARRGDRDCRRSSRERRCARAVRRGHAQPERADAADAGGVARYLEVPGAWIWVETTRRRHTTLG